MPKVTLYCNFFNLFCRIQHSRVAILKPQRKTVDQALEEVEEAIKNNEGKEKATESKIITLKYL